jgi:hypothetical protein
MSAVVGARVGSTKTEVVDAAAELLLVVPDVAGVASVDAVASCVVVGCMVVVVVVIKHLANKEFGKRTAAVVVGGATHGTTLIVVDVPNDFTDAIPASRAAYCLATNINIIDINNQSIDQQRIVPQSSRVQRRRATRCQCRRSAQSTDCRWTMFSSQTWYRSNATKNRFCKQ